MRAALALPLLLAVALAGCSVDTHRPPASTSQGPIPSAEPEPDGAVLQVAFRANATVTVEVPFPHMDSCLQPEHWMNGTTRADGAVPELREASGERSGRVLALAAPGAGDVQWQAEVPLAEHPPCQTLRYDPWSTEPDPQDGTVDVRADGDASGITVLVRWVRGGCGNATLYEGAATADGWSALPGRTIPAGGCG
jgi:hypothetical protein